MNDRRRTFRKQAGPARGKTPPAAADAPKPVTAKHNYWRLVPKAAGL
ncbi:MAG TPA: hypothetical protein VE981_12050 [Planctomycetota bacterium]|nr:hypothetical protein [Planctomycetota bacterium]